MNAVTCGPVQEATNATLHDCKETKTSNLLSPRELWSLFQTTKGEAMGIPTGGSAVTPEMHGKTRDQYRFAMEPWSKHGVGRTSFIRQPVHAQGAVEAGGSWITGGICGLRKAFREA